MRKDYPHVETERLDTVLVIRLANDAARNSLSREMRYSLRDITREIADDTTIRAVYLTAKGKTFCSGGDLRMLTDASYPWAVHRRFRHASSLFVPFLSLDRPVVCGVRGVAIGGGMGLALMADQIIVGESAQFHAGFYRLGVVPDCLTLFTLPRLVGLAKARNFLYGEKPWDAAQIVDLGLATRMVADEAVDDEGIALARKLATGPAEVMGFAKQLLLRSFESTLTEMMDYEGLGQVLAMAGPEFQEGLAALRDKRPADFPGAARKHAPGDGMGCADAQEANGQ
jgi:2-(1,2-epoxy-1,2-dihydrophenyl)acetyl-CoA isomerase